MKRFRSLTEIENFRESREIRIPIFDKKSAEFCFEKSREIFNKPFAIDLATPSYENRSFDKKTRDLIGENLLDIEKTLNALNLDFLQAFNDLEKTDSAETLFGDNFLLENSLKSQNSMKTMTNFKKYSSASKDLKKPEFIPQENKATSNLFVSGGKINKNSNLFLSPTKQSKINQTFNPTDHIPRQRSMSFNENLEVKSQIFSPKDKTDVNRMPNEVRKTGSLDEDQSGRNYLFSTQSHLNSNKQRHKIACKPRSVRARNLRRLSYNPLNLINSSSSSESDKEQSMALSECDIRSKEYSKRFQKRHQQNAHRRTNSNTSNSFYPRTGSNFSNSNVNARERLYGSNASIKSAPNYNHMSERYVHEDFILGGGDDKTAISSSDIDSDEGFNNSINNQGPKKLPRNYAPVSQVSTHSAQAQASSNFNNIYDFVGKCFNRNYSATMVNNKRHRTKPTQNYLKSNHPNSELTRSNLNALYSDFDVSKLTGKSPTSQTYFDILDYSNVKRKQQVSQNDNKTLTNSGTETFRWPEKIHGSTVKQNDLIWQLQQDLHVDDDRETERSLIESLIMKQSAYTSDSTSTTENDSLELRKNFMPPSPAP